MRRYLQVFIFLVCLAYRGHAAVPKDVREQFALSPRYTQYESAHGLPVVGSDEPSAYALKEAAYLINQMLDGRDDIRAAMIQNKVRFTVMAATELTTDVPEHSDLKPKNYWDMRARGLGASRARPSVSCGEENLLCLSGDPYRGENILIHEFAHAIHQMGVNSIDKSFDKRLKNTFEDALAAGLWKGTYAASNPGEYWAEGVQSWFDCNQKKGGVHNGIGTRAQLKEYDPGLCKLILEIFGDKPWRYVRPQDRKDIGHLRGFDRSAAPRFAWPKELMEWSRTEEGKRIMQGKK